MSKQVRDPVDKQSKGSEQEQQQANAASTDRNIESTRLWNEMHAEVAVI